MTKKTKRINIKSYAKINLSLDVLGKMENGYHQVKMVMQMVGLHDDVFIQWIPEDSGEKYLSEKEIDGNDLQIELNPGKPYIPSDERNLAYKGALLMAEEGRKKGKKIKGKLKISIKKRIPVAAGLAGGSGNGAALILGLNKIWNMDIDLKKLCDLGGQLGADVSFSIMGMAKLNKYLGFSNDSFAATCALAEGTGTQLKPLPAYSIRVVLSKPSHSVSTKEVYQGMESVVIKKHPNIEEQIEGIKAKKWEKIKNNVVNVLENYTLKHYDRVMYTKNKMQEICKNGVVLMSGSGPTVFAITHDEEEQEILYTKLRKVNRETYRTKTME